MATWRSLVTHSYDDAVCVAVAGVMVFAGRHLQHGDAHQRQRSMERE